jgi:hypothetical protein
VLLPKTTAGVSFLLWLWRQYRLQIPRELRGGMNRFFPSRAWERLKRASKAGVYVEGILLAREHADAASDGGLYWANRAREYRQQWRQAWADKSRVPKRERKAIVAAYARMRAKARAGAPVPYGRTRALRAFVETLRIENEGRLSSPALEALAWWAGYASRPKGDGGRVLRVLMQRGR